MKYVGVWCPEALIDAVEAWIKREKRAKFRRVNRSDFLLEAIMEKLQREAIPVESEAALHTGEKRVSRGANAPIDPSLDESPEAVEAGVAEVRRDHQRQLSRRESPEHPDQTHQPTLRRKPGSVPAMPAAARAANHSKSLSP